MKIEYRILWVEDNKSWFKTTKNLFADYLDEIGFKLVCERCENIDEVRVELERNGLVDYDLLLVDYSLKGDTPGDEVINIIRNFGDHQILTEVLFYSSAIENVRDSMRKHSLEGVYTADRKDIETKFEQVVGTTIKKVQDINAMRGLIMAETSELDNLMLSIIVNKINKNTERSEQLVSYIFEKVKEFNNANETKFNELLENNDIEGVLNSAFFHTMIRAKSVHKLIKLMNNPKFTDLENFTNDYDKDVISVRNNFAHVVEVIDEDTGQKKLVSHLNGRDIEFTTDRCISIRKNLIRYSGRLNAFKSAI